MINLTLEQISKNTHNLAMEHLVDVYNSFSGKKPIKKFPTIEKGREEVKVMVDELIEKKRASEAKAASKGDANVPSISMLGWEALLKIRECLKAWQDSSMTVEELAAEVHHPEANVQKTVNVLERDGFLVLIKGESKPGVTIKDKYGLTELGKTVKKGKSSGKAPVVRTRGKTGPKSELSGKKLVITKEGKAYKAREGSKRGKAWLAIKDGMTYDAYREAGGNAFDLGFFQEKGYITLS